MDFYSRSSLIQRYSHSIPSFRWRRKGAFVAVSLALVILIGSVLLCSYFFTGTEQKCEAGHGPNSVQKKKSQIYNDISSQKTRVALIKHTLKRDDTLYSILNDNGITPKEISHLITDCKKTYDLNRVQPESSLELEIDTTGRIVKSLKYQIDEETLLSVQRSGDGFTAKKERIEYETKLTVQNGEISNSLFEAVVDAGLSPKMAINMGDIFAWDIDFNVDLRKEDRFTILFEKKYRDEKFVKDGQILCAQFINQGKTFWAVFFEDKDHHVDYYDLNGASLRKQFLKSPLRYTYISSGYSKRRLHPILKIYRPHLGIDYAAPVGTPVVAVGDGKIIFAGRKGGYGKFIKIRHNSTYTTMYGHLSRFAAGIKRNRYVKQGQLIGYVGSTGLSTGPHLDFRLLKNGKFVNPLTSNPPSANPVRKRYMRDFELVKKKVLRKLKHLDTGGTVWGG